MRKPKKVCGTCALFKNALETNNGRFGECHYPVPRWIMGLIKPMTYATAGPCSCHKAIIGINSRGRG